MKLEISRAAPHELSVVLRLLREQYDFHQMEVADSPALVDRLLRNESLGRVWLLRDGTTAVGLMVLTFGYDIEFGGSVATLTDLYVAVNHRRKGLGTAALRFIEDFCRQQEIAALELQVERTNAAARAFYDRVGFMSHDRIPMSKRIVRD